MKKLLLLSIALCLTIVAQAIHIVVTNTAGEYREQVIELPADTLYQLVGPQFIIKDAAGLEVPYQTTHNGKILLQAGVRPHGTLTFTAESGTPKDYPWVCYGRLVPERKDDYCWENDRGVYRVYGPELQRTGERSYGIDVWTKNTPELVVDYRYRTEEENIPHANELRKTDRQAGDLLYRQASYHNDHGRGMDLYKVGPTLGCGTPALIVENKLIYPWCFKTCQTLDNGPLRTTVKLDYPTTLVNGDSITEHRLITLDKGSNFNRMDVWYDGITKPVELASGVVIHSEDKQSVVLGKDYVQYADPTDNIEVNNCQLFVATIYPNGVSRTEKKMFEQPTGGNEGHALGIVENYKGETYTYYFGSAWSKFDVRTQDEWQNRIDWMLRQLKNPLKVTIKIGK